MTRNIGSRAAKPPPRAPLPGGKMVGDTRGSRMVWVVCAALALQTGVVRAAEKPPLTPVAEITTEYQGKVITVQGTITGSRVFKAGMRYTLSEGSAAGSGATGGAGATTRLGSAAKITLVLFEKARASAPGITQGATVRVRGKVDFYQDAAQLVVQRGGDIVVLAQGEAGAAGLGPQPVCARSARWQPARAR